MKGKRYETVADLQKHTDAVIRAEAAVVREAKHVSDIRMEWEGGKMSSRWYDALDRLDRAVARLEKLEGAK